MNKILNIEVVKDFRVEAAHSGRLGFVGMVNVLSGYGEYDGYKVDTDDGEIYLLIDNGQSCCESWGYLTTEDDLQQYIGADLLQIDLTDTSLKTEPIEEPEYLDEGGVQFVSFKTDRGVFQLAVYNGHNGYYGHGIYLFKYGECLLNACL